MIVEVPFGYGADVIDKGKRKRIPRILKSSVMVDVEAVSSADAPLVFRWHTGPYEPTLDYRITTDGVLHTSVLTDNGSSRNRPMTLQDAVSEASRGRKSKGADNPLFAGQEFGMLMRGHFVSADDLAPGSQVLDSTEDVEAAKIRAQAAELLVIDGLLFRRDPRSEPVYRVENGEISTCRADKVAQHLRDARRYFRIDQAPDALAAAGIGHPVGQPEADFDFDDVDTYRGCFRQFVEVLDPSVVSYRADQNAVLLAKAAGFVHVFRENLADEPVEHLLAYGHLRDAVRRRAVASELCPLMESLAETAHDSWRREILDATEGYRMAPVAEEAPSAGGPRP